jgi:hypothetical protein
LPEALGGEAKSPEARYCPHRVLPAFRLVKSPQTAIVRQEFGVFVEFFLIDGSKSFAEQRGPDRN